MAAASWLLAPCPVHGQMLMGPCDCLTQSHGHSELIHECASPHPLTRVLFYLISLLRCSPSLGEGRDELLIPPFWPPGASGLTRAHFSKKRL